MKEDLLKKLNELTEVVSSMDENTSNSLIKETIEEGLFSDIEATKEYLINEKNIIKTGFKSIDESIGGFAPGEISVIGGRPSMGKTALLLSMAVNISLNISKSIPALYINLENSVNQTVKRIVDYNFKEKGIKDFSNLELYIMSSSGYIDTITKKITEYVETKSIKIVFIDYIQLISVFNNKRYRDLELSVVMRKLKQVAKQNNIPIVLASQLNRNIELRGTYRNPVLTDLRDSGSIEQEADKVLFIHRPEYYGITENMNGNDTKGYAEIIIAKNRSGITGTVSICYKTPVAFHNCKVDNNDFGDINSNIIFN